MATAETKSDISATDGALITTEAASWKGTPYSFVGAGTTKGENGGGDCSGTTWRIYSNAGFKYEYQATATFPQYVMDK
jgi:cell wall-associated NlpC family hydrolase